MVGQNDEPIAAPTICLNNDSVFGPKEISFLNLVLLKLSAVPIWLQMDLVQAVMVPSSWMLKVNPHEGYP